MELEQIRTEKKRTEQAIAHDVNEKLAKFAMETGCGIKGVSMHITGESMVSFTINLGSI